MSTSGSTQASNIAIREQAVSAKGIRLWVAEAGGEGDDYPALLLLHGIWDRWESWQPVMPSLAQDYHLIVPELRGHGRSDHPAGGVESYRLADYAADLVGLLDALGIARVSIVGHSLGARIAALLAAEQPERVRAVVLEDPPVRLGPSAASIFSLLLEAKNKSEAETYALVQDAYWQRGEDEWRRITDWLRGTADGPFEAIIAAAGPGSELFPTLARISCPVLVLQADPAEGAALGDVDAAETLESLPHGRLERFPATGHAIHRERPEQFVAVVSTFLKEAASD